MDRRLASILCSAFDDCSCVDQMFKLLSIAGTLIERPVIKEDFDAKYKDAVLIGRTHFFMTHLGRWYCFRPANLYSLCSPGNQD